MRSWLLDRLVLVPTRDPIDPDGKVRDAVDIEGGDFEVWRSNADAPGHQHLVVIKFPGTAGRAERATHQPFHLWNDVSVETWAVNPRGYGQTRGRASLAATLPMVEALRERLDRYRSQHTEKRVAVVVSGNSLGNLAALKLASMTPVDGLLLRNPPPLGDVVRRRSRYWRAGWIGDWLANGLSTHLDPEQIAPQCSAPALFVHCELDTLVPMAMQSKIRDVYQGPTRHFVGLGLDHADPIPEEQESEFERELTWLRQQIFPRA